MRRTTKTQWICGPDASDGFRCRCADSVTECACLAIHDGSIGFCLRCGAYMVLIDFESGETVRGEALAGGKP